MKRTSLQVLLTLMAAIALMAVSGLAFSQEGPTDSPEEQAVIDYLTSRDSDMMDPNGEYYDPYSVYYETSDFFWSSPAFQTDNITVQRSLVSGDVVALEVNYSATQTGEYNGMAADSQNISLPMAIFARVNDDGTITSLSAYYDTRELGRQLGMDEAAVTGEDTGVATNDTGNFTNLTLDELLDNPEDYYGQQVSVQGTVGDFVGEDITNDGFLLSDDDLLFEDEALVIGSRDNALVEWGLVGDQEVIVTGTVREYALSALEDEIGYDLDDDFFNEYENRPVIVASQITPVDD